MAITALPTPAPASTMSEADFDAAANALLGALPTFVTEANALASDVTAKQGTATTAAGTATTQAGIATTKAGEAAASAAAASLASNATMWVSGGSYTLGQLVWSPIDFETYRAITDHDSETTDPSLDGTNWLSLEQFSGDYADLSGKPTLFSGAYADLTGKPTLGTAAAQNTTAFATAAQGTLAGTAVQPARNIIAGTGLTGGGTLAGDRTLNIDVASASDIRAATANKVLTADGIPSALALTTPSGGSNFAPDFNTFMVADWAVTANRTLSNPTNVAPGETRYVFIRATSGTRAITFGSYYKGDLPTLDDVTTTKWYLLSLVAYSTTHIVVASVVALS